MALILKDRCKETTTTTGTGTVTLAGASSGFQALSAVGDGNTTYYCIASQTLSEWEVGVGTYTLSGTTLSRGTVLSSSNAGSLVTFSAGVKDVFVTYPSEKGVWLDASGNASALGTPASFVGTNITGTATSFTASNVTTNANLTGGVTSVGNAATVVTNANLTGGVTSVGNAATVVTNANLTGGVTSVGNAATVVTNANLTGMVTSVGNAASLGSFTSAQLATALTDETGSGANVFATSPTLVTPLLGTPTSGVLTNLTGLPLTTGVTGTLPVASGGTSLATLTVNNLLVGAGTSAPTFIAPSTTGNVLTSNGTTWTSATPAGGSAIETMDVKTTGTSVAWTIPTGKTTVRITVVGGGGGGGDQAGSGSNAGGGGGASIQVFTGLTPGNTLTYTVGAGGGGGASGSTSQVISGTQTIATISATGGAAGSVPSGGMGSGGSLNIGGGPGMQSVTDSYCGGWVTSGGAGGNSIYGGGGASPSYASAGRAGTAYGGGGSAAFRSNACCGHAGGAGAAGVIIFEY